MNIDIKKVWNLNCPNRVDLWHEDTSQKGSVSSYKPRTACLPRSVVKPHKRIIEPNKRLWKI